MIAFLGVTSNHHFRHNLRFRHSLQAVAAISALAITSAGAQTDKAPEGAYRELVKRVSGGDLTVDFRALRLACASASTCDPRGESKDLIAMRRAVQAGDHRQATKAAELLIAAGFPNIEAHATCAQTYAALNEPDKAKFHQAVASALMRSILASGDGKTKESAFEVIGTPEEYITVMALGFTRPVGQSLITDKSHSFDVLEVNDPKTGQKISVYFNIDAFYPMKGL